jgi:hypothetical protein
MKEGGTWHIEGKINVRPKAYLKIVLGHLKKITELSPESRTIMLVPVALYTNGKCCENPDHVKISWKRVFRIS